MSSFLSLPNLLEVSAAAEMNRIKGKTKAGQKEKKYSPRPAWTSIGTAETKEKRANEWSHEDGVGGKEVVEVMKIERQNER